MNSQILMLIYKDMIKLHLVDIMCSGARNVDKSFFIIAIQFTEVHYIISIELKTTFDSDLDLVCLFE